MTLTHFAIIAVCAYLFGSLSFAIIVSKVTLGKDIRNYGSGNAGLTNAYRTMGAKKTLFVLLGDIAKGAAAVSVGWALGGPVGKLTAGILLSSATCFHCISALRAARVCWSARLCSRFLTGACSLLHSRCSSCSVVLTKWISSRFDPRRGQLSDHDYGCSIAIRC